MSKSKPNQNVVTASNILQPRQRMTQNYLLIWVDASIDAKNKNCQDTLNQLKNVINNINLCTQPDQCIQLLNQIDDERAFVIISSAIGQHLVPEIHDLPQLDTIYIFCDNKSKHHEWTQNWTKIKDVYTNVKKICQELQLAVKQCDQDLIAVSFVTINEMASTDNLNQLEPTFMYTQIFKEILLDIEYDRKAIKDLTIFCRKLFTDNKSELQIINEFERDYSSQKAIWWYTRECFTYKMLNRALRTLDADTIINMGFFLRDLHQQIQQLYEQQFSAHGGKSFVVYRGQGFMKSDFEKLQKTKGGLMSFNNFLSTSKKEQVSLSFAKDASVKPDMVGILFIMSIDPSIKSTPFASVNELGYYEAKEDEILFSMHTVFRVGEIKQINNKNQLYQVELQLTSDDDEQLRLLTNRIREEASGSTGWRRLGNLLLKIGQFNKAEELYNVLLEQTSDEGEKALYYNQLGFVHSNQGNYEKAIGYFEQQIKVQQKTLPSNNSYLAISYGNIGGVYDKIGDYPKALSFYEKALELQQKTLPSNQLHLATSYSNIGSVYYSMEEYSKALSSHEKALGIYQKALPSNHPDLATSYNNIGSVHDKMGEYETALSCYEKAHEILQKTLPSNHPHLAASYNNIGSVYDKMGEYEKALSFYGKALEIYENTLSSNHPHLATSYNNISNVYYNMKNYSKALSYLEHALDIFQHTLPPTHPHIKAVKESIETVKKRL
ncbi:unnamed protein product [Adineta steineri]|uniref:Kinesin light chain n=1 Tax=Adineta steineri TaxID=433720 RepID=A0A815ZFZ3_9BILA|nr:unnamed protein product [Adineta steineri]CAF1582306.1 unnamed protein product [Adineta steineri]